MIFWDYLTLYWWIESFLIHGNMVLYTQSKEKLWSKRLIDTERYIVNVNLAQSIFKCLCNRIITFVTNEIAFWQRAYLEKRHRQELIFLPKTEIDDFRNLSTKMIVTFINFKDAFGSVSHDFIFKCLEQLSSTWIYYVIQIILHSTWN